MNASAQSKIMSIEPLAIDATPSTHSAPSHAHVTPLAKKVQTWLEDVMKIKHVQSSPTTPKRSITKTKPLFI